jgi:hypothetical protein
MAKIVEQKQDGLEGTGHYIVGAITGMSLMDGQPVKITGLSVEQRKAFELRDGAEGIFRTPSEPYHHPKIEFPPRKGLTPFSINLFALIGADITLGVLPRAPVLVVARPAQQPTRQQSIQTIG